MADHSDKVSDTKRCSACAEIIKTKAVICRFCGHDQRLQLQPTQIHRLAEEKPSAAIVPNQASTPAPWDNLYSDGPTTHGQGQLEQSGEVMCRGGGLRQSSQGSSNRKLMITATLLSALGMLIGVIVWRTHDSPGKVTSDAAATNNVVSPEPRMPANSIMSFSHSKVAFFYHLDDKEHPIAEPETMACAKYYQLAAERCAECLPGGYTEEGYLACWANSSGLECWRTKPIDHNRFQHECISQVLKASCDLYGEIGEYEHLEACREMLTYYSEDDLIGDPQDKRTTK